MWGRSCPISRTRWVLFSGQRSCARAAPQKALTELSTVPQGRAPVFCREPQRPRRSCVMEMDLALGGLTREARTGHQRTEKISQARAEVLDRERPLRPAACGRRSCAELEHQRQPNAGVFNSRLTQNSSAAGIASGMCASSRRTRSDRRGNGWKPRRGKPAPPGIPIRLPITTRASPRPT